MPITRDFLLPNGRNVHLKSENFFMAQNSVYIISGFTCFAIETVKNNGKNTVIYVYYQIGEMYI